MRYCGIDIGTTNTKAVVIDDDGQLVDRVTLPLPEVAVADRLDAATWRRQFGEALNWLAGRGSLGGKRFTCSLSTQGGSFACVDEKYQPLDLGFSWMGRSAERWPAELAAAFGREAFYLRTGWPPLGFGLPAKVKEWRVSDAERARRLRYVAQVPEFILADLGGRFVTDETNAQISGFYDVIGRDWWDEVVAWAGLRREMLAEVRRPAEFRLDDVTAGGLRFDLIGCAHDQYASMFACDLEAGRAVNLATGTAWVVNGSTDELLFDREHLLTHPGRDVVAGRCGFIAVFGAVGKGFSDLLARAGAAPEELEAMTADLTRCGPPTGPVRGELRRGRLDGADASAEAIRRFMEAVSAKARYLIETTVGLATVGRVIMTGGAVRSRFWTQVLASVLSLPVEVVSFPELSAYGAAILGRFVRTGARPDRRWPAGVAVETVSPETGPAKRYREWYETHRKAVVEDAIARGD